MRILTLRSPILSDNTKDIYFCGAISRDLARHRHVSVTFGEICHIQTRGNKQKLHFWDGTSTLQRHFLEDLAAGEGRTMEEHHEELARSRES
mmetsp:Transcript_4032/g.5907  ORF Transcript_4032/g.5907 Transcript_4032/m.5907 type:complete len:92 (-) Transcript_4032:1808-2083(-)